MQRRFSWLDKTPSLPAARGAGADAVHLAETAPAKRYALGLAGVAVLLGTCLPAAAQSGAKNGEWRTYGGDLGNTHYSPLDQINAANFGKLQVAWRLKTENLGPKPE